MNVHVAIGLLAALLIGVALAPAAVAARTKAPVADPPLCNQHKTYGACVACARRRGYPASRYASYCANRR